MKKLQILELINLEEKFYSKELTKQTFNQLIQSYVKAIDSFDTKNGLIKIYFLQKMQSVVSKMDKYLIQTTKQTVKSKIPKDGSSNVSQETFNTFQIQSLNDFPQNIRKISMPCASEEANSHFISKKNRNSSKQSKSKQSIDQSPEQAQLDYQYADKNFQVVQTAQGENFHSKAEKQRLKKRLTLNKEMRPKSFIFFQQEDQKLDKLSINKDLINSQNKIKQQWKSIQNKRAQLFFFGQKPTAGSTLPAQQIIDYGNNFTIQLISIEDSTENSDQHCISNHNCGETFGQNIRARSNTPVFGESKEVLEKSSGKFQSKEFEIYDNESFSQQDNYF